MLTTGYQIYTAQGTWAQYKIPPNEKLIKTLGNDNHLSFKEKIWGKTRWNSKSMPAK